jgi:CDP-diacylglycerol--glycerol-3-phosphate 3-phosphatidyltransferase
MADLLSKQTPLRETVWNIPNQLTIARLLLSVVFFVLLALETHESSSPFILNVSLVIFALAIITDFLDGYLARKWKLTSTFGRIADPFADKIVVCGAFVMLTGVAPELVDTWFAVVIIFREFLVSGLRSFLESRGVAFGSAWTGKLKMLVQSLTIPMILFYQANLSTLSLDTSFVATFAYWLTISLLTATLILTIASCSGYIQRAIKLIREDGVR